MGGFDLVVKGILGLRPSNKTFVIKEGTGRGALGRVMADVERELVAITPLFNGNYLIEPKFGITLEILDKATQTWRAVTVNHEVTPGVTLRIKDDRRIFTLPRNPSFESFRTRVVEQCRRLRLKESVVIGRDNIPFETEPAHPELNTFNANHFYTLSREHVSVTRILDGYLIKDLKESASNVGVYVRKRDGSFSRVDEQSSWQAEVKPGAVVRLGLKGPVFKLPSIDPKYSHVGESSFNLSETLLGNQRPLVRQTELSGAVQPDYKRRAKEARVLFSNWLQRVMEGDERITVQMFTEMNNKMHQISHYEGKSGTPGRVRSGEHLHVNRSEARAYVQKVFEEHGQKLGLGEVPNGRIAITGIEENKQPISIHEEWANGYHQYPRGDDLGVYFARGAEILQQIVLEMKGTGERAKIRDLIGQYYHVMVNARPYDSVNNSMYMNQVNFLLTLNKFAPLTHGDLDHLFHRVNSEQAAKLWRLAVDNQLPNSVKLGTGEIK
jgi:hypothetical protein